MKIPLDKIKLLRHHLRRDLDPEQLRALAEDMQRHGQIQPVAVKQLPNEEWELIAGRRRCDAARLLGWTEIEAHALTWSDKVELPALAENLKRSQLTPLEEADAVAWMHTEGNMSIGEITEKTGHGTSWVQDRLAVGNLPENLKNAVHTRALSISAALLLAQITDEDYRNYLLHCAKTNGATVHQVEAWWLDWQARQKLIAAQNWDGVIPQPPPLPPPPPFTCFLCAETHPRVNAVVVTICADCSTTVKTEMAKAKAGLASPADGSQTADKEEP